MMYMTPFDQRSSSLFDAFDRMMNGTFWGRMEKQCAPCRTDIIDAGSKFVLRADMPGFQKENIKVSVKDNELTISAERQDNLKDTENNKYVYRERRYDSLSRSFDIKGIDTDKITASYENGVLELQLPKVVETKPDAQAIKID